MKTLKELLVSMPSGGDKDLDVIKQWFIENEKEQVGLSLIPALAQSQANRIQKKYDYALSWVPYLQDMKDFIKDKEVADKLNKLQTYCALNYPMQEDNPILLWARENIHNKMKIPKVFFLPTVAYLQRYGVEFIMTAEQRKHILNMQYNPNTTW